MGWDRPLQGVFMFVERISAIDEEDVYVYQNLNDPGLDRGFSSSPDYFVKKLTSLGLSVPLEMVDAVIDDSKQNAGNKLVQYRLDTPGKMVIERRGDGY